jgi:hypothetical protein
LCIPKIDTKLTEFNKHISNYCVCRNSIQSKLSFNKDTKNGCVYPRRYQYYANKVLKIYKTAKCVDNSPKSQDFHDYTKLFSRLDRLNVITKQSHILMLDLKCN